MLASNTEMPSQPTAPDPIPEWRIAMIDLFVSGALLLGLPKSVGQIYGYLYSAAEPAPMDKIISELVISKGSASQGLKFLRQLGAVKAQFVLGDRRDHFVAEVNSERLLSGFIREKLSPSLDENKQRLVFVREQLTLDGLVDDKAYESRVLKLETWNKNLRKNLTLIRKALSE